MSTLKARPFLSRTTVLACFFDSEAFDAPLREAAIAGWVWPGWSQPEVTQVNIMGASLQKGESENSKVLRNQVLVAADAIHRAAKGDPPGVEDDDLVGEVESELHVLLDQQDRLPFRLQAGDDAAHLGDDQRRQSFRRLVH